MAGSVYDVRYTTDANEDFFITVDRSNFQQASGTAGAALTPAINKLPSNITPRRAVYKSPDKLYSVVVPISNVARLAALPQTIKNYKDIDCGLQTVIPERRRSPRLTDTGQTNP